MNYKTFIADKLGNTQFNGIDAPLRDYSLFPHQSELTGAALRRGRYVIAADTGLGKSRMQSAWADMVRREAKADVLILAPLAVAEQTVGEAASIGVEITHARDDSDIRPGINITNYDRLHKFDCGRFGGIVLDESSIIKHVSSKTFQTLCDVFRHTPYKLACTATPAPNDWTELGNHAEFLGVRSRAEMLAEYFCHDGGETQVWRLKGHARRDFWRWVASWCAMVRSPADLGHDASAYKLPPLSVHQHTVEIQHSIESGQLFAVEAQTLMERRDARRQSMVERVRACAAIVNADRQPWVVWCDLNAEGDALEASIDGAIQIAGADDADTKERRLSDFAHGRARVLVSKPSICGFGLNWQHCARMAFVGVTDSWESYYQAVRRCWRFGQKRPVDVHVFASSLEGAVVANLKRKEQDAKAMADAMAAETMDAVRSSILGSRKETNDYTATKQIIIPSFLKAA